VSQSIGDIGHSLFGKAVREWSVYLIKNGGERRGIRSNFFKLDREFARGCFIRKRH